MPTLAQTQFIPEIPLADWTNTAVAWITETFEWFFEPLGTVIEVVVGALVFVLTAPPELVIIAALAAIAFFSAGWRVALFTFLGLLLIISLDLWSYAMLTLALVMAATVVCLAIGIPIGILAAKSRGVEAAARPTLDLMQTMPAFVYLVPAVLLFTLGNAPALVATVVFATPPAVRLTMLGIQQVPKDTVEAAQAFGSTPWQTLVKVELPLSVRSIMAGVNQVIMLALSMVVIAALVGAQGLGVPVVQGLGQLDTGTSFVGGVGIVILAVMLDRITRGLAEGGKGGVSKVFSRKGSRPEPGTAAVTGGADGGQG